GTALPGAAQHARGAAAQARRTGAVLAHRHSGSPDFLGPRAVRADPALTAAMTESGRDGRPGHYLLCRPCRDFTSIRTAKLFMALAFSMAAGDGRPDWRRGYAGNGFWGKTENSAETTRMGMPREGS